VARRLILAIALVAALLPVAGAGGAPEQAPKRGGTLVFAQPQPEPACLNMLLPQCVGVGGIQLITVWRLVLEAPFDLGGDLTWRPSLVSGATFTTRPPYTLTYHIRPEARWNDGIPVTARDFAFTHAAILRYDNGPLKALHSEVRSVRVVDPKTVRVILRSRLGDWQGLFRGIYPAHVLRGANLLDIWRDRINDPRTGRPVGSGPFLVERWDRGRQIVLVRNAHYWGPHRSHIDRLVIRFVGAQGEDLGGLLRGGQVHVAYNFPPSVVDEARSAGLDVVSGPSTAMEYMSFRIGPGGNPLLRRKLVRRAIAYGIDRPAIVSRLSAESRLRFLPLQSATLLTQSPDYQPVWKDYRYRPAESRRLLEQAGCRPGGDAIYVCDGVRLSLRFVTLVGPDSIRPGIVEQMQAQLRRVGVEVVPMFAPPNAVFGPGGILARGAFDAAVTALMRASQGANTRSFIGCGGVQNFSGYCQRLVTSDLDQADRIFDTRRQAAALIRADRRLAQDVPLVPLFQHPTSAVLGADVRGFALNSTTGVAGAVNWWFDD
jgi:ABC-type transport system substrate-binding protein